MMCIIRILISPAGPYYKVLHVTQVPLITGDKTGTFKALFKGWRKNFLRPSVQDSSSATAFALGNLSLWPTGNATATASPEEAAELAACTSVAESADAALH